LVPQSIGGPEWQFFSGVCWFYGVALHKALGVPVGLVSSSYGGTSIIAWSSPDTLAECGVGDDATADSRGKRLPLIRVYSLSVAVMDAQLSVYAALNDMVCFTSGLDQKSL
jgi:hypothetical protein